MSRAPRLQDTWLTRSVAIAVAALVWLAAPPSFAERAISAVCTTTEEFALPSDSGIVPVVVTYMKNARRPGDDVETALPKSRLLAGFQGGGEFNSIWRPQGIELALVGFRTCSYALGETFDPDGRDHPRPDVPKPDASFESIFLTLLRDHNTRTVKNGAGHVAFRGLDLYLWWDIAGYPAYAVRPRFGAPPEVARGENDVPAKRPGAIWMDKECAESSPDSCAGLFAHEAGHFFGLCHCCHRETENPTCINALKPNYCPGLGMHSPQHVSCSTTELAKRLMSATNPHTDLSHRELIDCELEAAREGARRLLKFGANLGISDHPRGR